MQQDTINVSAAKTSELVDFYNRHAHLFGKHQVSKFSDRATAELRVKQMLADIAALPDDETVTATEAPGETSATEATSDKKEQEAQDERDIRRSAAIAASWQNADVREARSTRYNVYVDGVEYASVAKAFAALSLPKSKIVSFRALLVKHGVQAIEGHKFTLAS